MINKMRRAAVNIANKLGHKRKWIISLFIILILVASFVAIVLIQWAQSPGNNNPKSQSNSTKDGTVQQEGLRDGVVASRQNLRSSVCQGLKTSQIESAFGKEVIEQKVTIPDTEDRDSTVSGCAYIMKNATAGGVKSITVIKRSYKTTELAESAYNKSIDVQKRKDLAVKDGEAFYAKEQKQAFFKNGRMVTTVTINADELVNSRLEESITEIIDSI